MPDPFRWPCHVRFSDTDASGRIHYSAMFRFMEEAEDEYLRHLGFPYSGFERGRVLSFPRVHVEAQFIAPLHYDDSVDIEVTVERVGSSSFTLYFAALLGETPVARGRITVVCISIGTGKAKPLPENLADTLRTASES